MFPSRRPGWSREAHREMRPRGMAVQPREGRTEPGLQAVWQFFSRAISSLADSAAQSREIQPTDLSTRTKHELLHPQE